MAPRSSTSSKGSIRRIPTAVWRRRPSVDARADVQVRPPRGQGSRIFGMPECGALYEQACDRFSRLGGTPVEIDFAPFAEAGELMFAGPWVAERRASISALMDIETDGLLDVTKAVLRTGALFGDRRLHRDAPVAAAPAVTKPARRRRCAGGAHRATAVPARRHEPRSDYAQQSPWPLLLLRQSLLDLCAVSIPNGALSNGIPMGVTLLAPAWSDRALIALARRLETGTAGEPFALTSRARAAC